MAVVTVSAVDSAEDASGHMNNHFPTGADDYVEGAGCPRRRIGTPAHGSRVIDKP
jgi:hypothetical protein